MCFFFCEREKNNLKKWCFGLTDVIESVLIWQPVYFCSVIYSRQVISCILWRITHALSLQCTSLLCLRCHCYNICNKLFNLFPTHRYFWCQWRSFLFGSFVLNVLGFWFRSIFPRRRQSLSVECTVRQCALWIRSVDRKLGKSHKRCEKGVFLQIVIRCSVYTSFWLFNVFVLFCLGKKAETLDFLLLSTWGNRQRNENTSRTLLTPWFAFRFVLPDKMSKNCLLCFRPRSTTVTTALNVFLP